MTGQAAISAVVSLALAVSAPAVSACQISMPKGFKNKPTLQAEDCSFRWAGPLDDISGGAVRGLEGRLFQLIQSGGSRALMVADCNTRQAIEIYGEAVPGRGIPGCFEVTDIMPALGRDDGFRIDGHANLAAMSDSARANGLRVSDRNVGGGYGDPSDAYDPFCGCDLSFADKTDEEGDTE